MKMSVKMLAGFNAQMNKELNSAHIYAAMEAWCEAKRLHGFAHWLRVQSGEERNHFNRLRDYVYSRSETVTLAAIPAPVAEYATLTDVFKAALAHEESITKSLIDLSKLADAEGDLGATIHLEWFITEQEEEESNAQDILDKLEVVASCAHTLYLLDKEMGTRQE